MFDPSGNQFQGLAGPMADVQQNVASVLNGNGDRPSVYIPGGPGEPVFQVPNVRYALAQFFAIFRGARGAHR